MHTNNKTSIKIIYTTGITLIVMFIFFLIYPLSACANGPMPSEIAEDMISIGAFTAPLTVPSSDTDSDIIATALNQRPSIVQVQVGKEYGSGNILSINKDQILIITAGHVVKNWDSTDNHFVIFYNGKIADATLITSDETYDAAILSVNTSSIDPYNLINLRAVNINPDVMPSFDKIKGETIIALDSDHQVNAKEKQHYDYYGSNTGIGIKYVYGPVINPNIMVSDYGYKMIYVRCDAHHGMSGGGVFDLSGNYLGILVGGTNKGETVAVRLSDIEALIQ